MPHNCCIPRCRKKGYRTVIIDSKEAKVSFHKLPNDTSGDLRKRWIIAIRRDMHRLEIVTSLVRVICTILVLYSSS